MHLYPRVPLIAPVFPETAFAAPEAAKAVDHRDAHDVFCVLVTKLALYSQPKRGAMPNRQIRAVHRIGEDRLWMKRIDQIDALVVAAAAIERFLQFIGAVEDGVTGVGSQSCRLQNQAEWDACPFADRTPAFDAVMTRDLGARRKPLEVRQRELLGPDDETIDL